MRLRPLIALLVPSLLGCAQATPTQDGTQRMVQRLAELTGAPGANSGFRGRAEKTLDGLRRSLEETTGRGKRAFLQREMGLILLREGRLDEALVEFQAIRGHLEHINAKTAPWIELHDLLATTHLRRAEADNCLALHGPESCLLPLAGSGVHRDRTGALRARDELLEALRLAPEHQGFRWLLNLVYMALGDYPDALPADLLIEPEVFTSEYPLPRFPNVAGPLGVNRLGMAGGVVLEDFDGDGDLDIMTSAWGLTENIVYYENLGNGGFTDRTEEAGLLGEVGGLNLCHADYDNDGDNDVFVLRGAWRQLLRGYPNSLLRNNGDGTFDDVTEAAGLLSFHPTQCGAWGDYDDDGWLDLFVGNESYPGAPHPCELYRNNGDGTFTDVALAEGVALEGFVKGAAWGDFDADGRLDLHVSKFAQANLLLHNEGDPGKKKAASGKRFRDVALAAGVQEPWNSFSTWFFDYDNDGWLDIFVAPFPGFMLDSMDLVARDYLGWETDLPRPRLFANQGDGTFHDVAESLGLDDGMLAMGANFGDIDNDGFLDVYIGTGEPTLHTLVPNRMYRNDRGMGFQNVTFAGGFGHLQKGHAIAFADLDNDGDQDIYAVMGGAYSGDVAYNALFLNPGNANRWLTLALEGTRSNRSALGAVIRVTVRTPGGRRLLYRTLGTGGSFGSSSLQQEIGLGAATELLSVEIRWPGTAAFVAVSGMSLDGDYWIREGNSAARARLRERIALDV